jgi:hypothetical protein
MTSGHVTKLPKGFKLKDGKVQKVAYYADASAAIRAKKSKKQRPQKRIV